MIYVKNNTEIQDVFIPRDEEIYIPSGGGGYSQGFADGRDWQKAQLTSGTFTENGDYFREDGWDEITIAVPQGDYAEGYADGVAWRDAQDIPGAFYENGTYHRTNGYGWSEVNVRVDTASTYNSGYTQGYEDRGDLLGRLEISANNMTYTSETGWNEVLVVITGFTGGFVTTATTNGHYEYDAHDFGVAGWDYITIDVDVPTGADYASGYTDGFQVGYNSGITVGYQSGVTDGYASGYTSGMTDGFNSGVTYQKSLLSSITLTDNGVYTSENGWSSVTVNQPISIGEVGISCVFYSKYTVTPPDQYFVTYPASGWYVQKVNNVFDSFGAPVNIQKNIPVHIDYYTNNVSSVPSFSLQSYLTEVVIDDRISVLRYQMFERCHSLTSVTLSNTIYSIPTSCFGGCDKLTSIVLPASIVSIGQTAFLGCSALTSITCYATTAPSVNHSFYSKTSSFPENGVLRVPVGSDYSSWFNGYVGLPSGWTVEYITI